MINEKLKLSYVIYQVFGDEIFNIQPENILHRSKQIGNFATLKHVFKVILWHTYELTFEQKLKAILKSGITFRFLN